MVATKASKTIMRILATIYIYIYIVTVGKESLKIES